MAKNPNQPRNDDAVLGGQAPSSSAVLGGVEGIKKRLTSSVEQQRIAALSEALKLGKTGLDLVIQALENSSQQVQQTAFWLLHEYKAEPKVKKVLQNYIPVNSVLNVDYSWLQDLLATGQWQKADRETLALMLQACHQEKNGWLSVEDIEHFPCIDLRTIDQLWANYSNGRFGFSAQKRIWQSIGGKPNADWETYCRFGERVGWRVRDRWLDEWNLTYTLAAPMGHLPALGEDRARITVHLRGVGDALFSRLDACQLS